MRNLPKWIVFLIVLFIIFLVGVVTYFTSGSKFLNTKDEARIITRPTTLPQIYDTEKLSQLKSDSKEVTGILGEGCNSGYLTISASGLKNNFKINQIIKEKFLGKEIVANIASSTTSEACGVTYKLGAIRDKENNIYVLGRRTCIPATDPRYKDDCWVGLKSQSGDYYSVDTIPIDYQAKISDFDLILVSGKLDKGKIKIISTNLITKDEYK